ncbi:lycopene beta-cyclase CrtY [Erythrobacter sp. 3-20A1M]|uniref:lycopene beta-cyclase CrtY n=1 Tax=Erythrobacter sp. 3-20A1M TaxID=2653850 RepID=UPI001BFC2928|nr:lycopene beta-cyclase CrtY [Erythrobacter sp. 3-20A1M]QWC57328.1 lycopene beta-cyclase CrtY [Erythrobacter sp. 3-20A1M]
MVGGGLAGGLTALALRILRPDVSVALVEAGDTLGGNHRWSWFASDLDPARKALLEPFRTARWDGNIVRFPRYERRLDADYFSLASRDFDATLRQHLAQETIRTGSPVERVDGAGVALQGGERITARAVIDMRGFSASSHLTGGWQVFMGRHLRTDRPHGVERPVIMDATVEQLGGYRFVYVLPLGPDEIFVEDTYYQDEPVLDREALSARLDAYCERRGWRGKTIGSETGVLPVVTGGDRDAHLREIAVPGVALAGARALIAHPLTSYTLPLAAETALLVARNADLAGPDMAELLAEHAQGVWDRTSHYRFLGHLLFDAAKPAERYRVFERFYTLPEGLIERFYAARPTPTDKFRVLAGIPPVPLHRAFRALARSGKSLDIPQQRTAAL